MTTHLKVWRCFAAYKLRLGINYAQFLGLKILNSTQKLLTVPGDVDENVRLRTHPTTCVGFSENARGLAELPPMDVVTPAGPLEKGDIVTKVYAPAPEDNINDTEGESGLQERNLDDPSVNDHDGECPSEQSAAHKRSKACEPLPSAPHSPVVRQTDGEGPPDRDPPDTPPSRRVSPHGHGVDHKRGARPVPAPPRKSGTRGSLIVEDHVGIPMFTNPDGTVTYLQGTVPETPTPTTSQLKKYDSSISCNVECAFDEPDQSDWGVAEARHIKGKTITTCGMQSLSRICKNMKPPVQCHPDHIAAYRQWLL